MTILRTNTLSGIGTTTFGPLLDGNLEFNSQNYIVLPKGTTAQEGVLRTTADVVGTGGTFYDNLVLAMPFNAATGLTDVSSRNRNPAAYGNVAISTAQSKYYGSSAYFDGSGDKLMITESSSDEFTFGTYDFTVEFFANPSNLSGSKCWITTADPISDEQGIWIGTANTNLYWLVGNGTWFLSGIVGTISLNTWQHIALTKSGTTFRAFIDGIQVDIRSDSTPITNTNNSISIGGRDAGAVQYSNGYLQDLRIYKGLAKYTSNFTPPERIAEIGVGFKAGQLRYNTDSNKVELYDGNQWTEVQSSRPDLNGGARGVFGGGRSAGPSFTEQNTIEYITISTTGNAVDFGDLISTRRLLSSCSSNTRGVFAGGITPSYVNTIDYITISSTGNAIIFGDLTQARLGASGCSNSTRGVFGGGYVPGGVTVNTIDYITIASTGNAVDFGDRISVIRYSGSCSSPTRGIWGGGNTPTNINTIDFITISTLGNSQDFGDLTQTKTLLAAASSATRGVFGGGDISPSLTDRIDFITISTTGNAVTFGNLTQARSNLAAASSATRGVFGGGESPTIINIIDYVTILTQGNAVDFGDLSANRYQLFACSNAHGGL